MRNPIALAIALTMSAAAVSSQAACMRCGPIQNVLEAPVPAAAGKAPSSEDVRKAIMRAGSTLGWQMNAEKPGLVVATLNIRKHTAVVEIPYSPKNYSIKYKSSVNLDESDGQIHNNYNGWVKNLAKGIDAQLSAP